ncbi:MAG: Gfo/Idh/MocA family oxidoreductase [Chitinophagaceae bacterium]|nr:MAG: Gfo/Idh/MocA family oxidoreductase [Chitinophagaceae bacterium]
MAIKAASHTAILRSVIVVFYLVPLILSAQKNNPLRIGVAGLTHSHVHWIFNSAKTENIEIVGIAEPNKELAARFVQQYNYPADRIYPTLRAMIDAQKPEAVAAFNSIAEHLGVVETCAPLGIHVMVEKPLAVSLADARKMETLATRNKILLLTNFETTWYSSVHKAHELVGDSAIGSIRKLVVHDGHQGPAEIGVNKEFLDWLTDPVKNGAGALMDFGCYGADLSTWLMKGQRPVTVTAVTQQVKPEKYPKVDDEATIIITYPKSQTVIQASWNWTFSRKDVEIYGTTGIIMAPNKNTITTRFRESAPDSLRKLSDRPAPYNDPFAFFRAAVRKEIRVEDDDLSSLRTNITVMEILDAAKRSALTGKTVSLSTK